MNEKELSDELKTEVKDHGSQCLRKTLRELDVTTLDALGTALAGFRIVITFLEEKKLGLDLIENLKKEELAESHAHALMNCVNLLLEFEKNMSNSPLRQFIRDKFK